MPKDSRNHLGLAPDTKGWRKLQKWLKAGNTPAKLAHLVNVSQPSAHAWCWRDSRPSDPHIDLICEITGATRDDWLTREERKAKADLLIEIRRAG